MIGRWLARRDQRRAPQLLTDLIDPDPADLAARVTDLEQLFVDLRADVEAVTVNG